MTRRPRLLYRAVLRRHERAAANARFARTTRPGPERPAPAPRTLPPPALSLYRVVLRRHERAAAKARFART